MSDPAAASKQGERTVDIEEGKRLLERWRSYTLAYANNAEDVTLEDWEEATKEAEDWAVENGLALIREAERLRAALQACERYADNGTDWLEKIRATSLAALSVGNGGKG